jgi:ABC-type multidrug transport system fused ATPase/permease subunit
MSAAVALIIYNYSDRVTSVIYAVRNILDKVKDFNLSASRIMAIINGDEFKKESFGTKHLTKVKGNFEFKNVCFSYDEKQVLNDLSFKVKANETVAFVGKSGAGKTTIFNLLCKMYDVKEGSILIDGYNINELDKDTIRGNITVISQNPYIFNMTIRENLCLVKENLSEEEMKKACKMACLDEFIESLPDKYDTLIGEGGVNLSGGQKQRLAIARAFVQNTEIILFDEATSALDNETQSSIKKAIDNMKKKYTILIIAHRLSTVIDADRLLYVEDGKIVGEGTHEELLKNNKSYRELYEIESIK